MERLLSERFTCSFHNQLPGLYCNDAVLKAPAAPYPPAQLSRIREGDGGGNIRLYFCDTEGRVAHLITGFCSPQRLLDEARFALALLEDAGAAKRLRETRGEALRRTLGGADPRGRAALCRRIQDLEEAPVGRDIHAVLRQVEDDVYLKGAVG